jgi:hypothetical protein
MRTLYTLFALISLVLVALVATAAPPSPTLSVTCSGLNAPNCASGDTPTYSGGGLNPHKSYGVQITGCDNALDPLVVDNNGNYSQGSSSGPESGVCTFELWLLDHNGNVSKEFPDTLQSVNFL